MTESTPTSPRLPAARTPHDERTHLEQRRRQLLHELQAIDKTLKSRRTRVQPKATEQPAPAFNYPLPVAAG